MSEAYFEVKDDVAIKYTPMPGMGESFYEREVVMTKEIFRKCYKAWVENQQQTGHWKFIQRGKCIDLCCSECGYVRVKDYAYNYTIDQIDTPEKRDFLAKSHLNFCECCGAKMIELQESTGEV